jgi:signal recognition particle GTPase
MFDQLGEKLQRTLKNLRGEGRLTETHRRRDAEIRIALPADVLPEVVKTFIDSVQGKPGPGGPELAHARPAGVKIVRMSSSIFSATQFS